MMLDREKRIQILSVTAGLGLGIFAAILVVFGGISAWSIRTIVYVSGGVGLLTATGVYSLVRYYLERKIPM